MNSKNKWSIDLFPNETFQTLVDVKQFILKNGMIEPVYEARSGKVIKTFAKVRKNMVCDICNCIRRTVTDVVDINSRGTTSRAARNEVDDVIYIGAHTNCSNPACIQYKEYLKKINKTDRLGYSECSDEGCTRVAVKGMKCEICGGPSIDGDKHISFDVFVHQMRMFRTSDHEILEKLRFLEDTGKDWIVPDRNKKVSEYFHTYVRWDHKFWNEEEMNYATDRGTDLDGFCENMREEAIENGG